MQSPIVDADLPLEKFPGKRGWTYAVKYIDSQAKRILQLMETLLQENPKPKKP